jgi:GNAT superfamily N-acetyltransferase
MSDVKWIWGSYDWQALHRLLHDAFADMEDRIDPSSSLHQMSPDGIAHFAQDNTIIVIEDTPDIPIACVFLNIKGPALYIGKLAVAPNHRGRGFAAKLIQGATHKARDLDLPFLELETRIELVENHAIFQAMGFAETAQTAHEGYAQPTSITMRKAL